MITTTNDEQSTVLSEVFKMNCSGAFDTVKHSILLDRFRQDFGIIGSLNKWLSSYFTDRTQQVNISGVLSDPISLTCGMPRALS